MFNLKSFIVTNIVNGVKNDTFTKEYANIMAVNYMLKGAIGEDEVVSVSSQIEAWEAEQAAALVPVEPSAEIRVDDLMEEETAETESIEEVEETISDEETTEEGIEGDAEEPTETTE